MIYARRALQRRLDELRGILGAEATTNLASRLNYADPDRVSAMWELVVLHGLSKCGHLQSEVALPSGRRPDILFEQGSLRFTADVTAVSDKGLDQNNPYFELRQLIEAAQDKLGLPMGGLRLAVGSKREKTKRGMHTTLLLPPRKQLQEFVRQKILPQLRDQIRDGQSPLRIKVDDDSVSLDITIDSTKSRYGSGSFAAYDIPRIKDRNPLFSALKAKADQLRGATGIKGIIVGDGDCVALSRRATGSEGLSTNDIIDEFFRQFTSIDFVVILTVHEKQHPLGYSPPVRENSCSLFIREEHPALKGLFKSLLQHFPKPTAMPINGTLRANEEGYDLGHHGGYVVSGTDTVRIGLREFTEIFAGLRTLQDGGARNVEAARKLPQEQSILQTALLQNLMAGRLPESVEIIKTGEDDSDDWVEIRFGEIDPAIAPLR